MLTGLAPAFSFLTRFGPARAYDEAELSASCRYFPLVGLAVGMIALAPSLVPTLAKAPLAAGVLGVALSLWATRLLHADGLADICDAVGSNAQGEAFFAIMKDSRCGAFAVAGVATTLLLQAACLAELIARHQAAAGVFAFVAARGVSSELAVLCRPLARPGLGRTMLAGITRRDLWISRALVATCALLTGSLGLAAAMLAGAGLACAVLGRLARARQGFSGDFWGAAIVAGEAAALVGAVMAG